MTNARSHPEPIGEGPVNPSRDELIPGLPNDVVLGVIWPKLVRYRWTFHGTAAVDQVRTMREVNVAWRDMVQFEDYWVALKQLLLAGQPRPEWIADGWSLDSMMAFVVQCMREGIGEGMI